MNKKIILIGFVFVVLSIYGNNLKSIEDLNMPVGLGIDIDIENQRKPKYTYYSIVYNYNTPQVTSLIYKGHGKNFNEIRTQWQLQMNKKLMIGSEKVYLLSETFAQFGIKNFIDDYSKEPIAQDRGHVIICDGNPYEFLNLKIDGYSNATDYIEEILNNIGGMDFFYYDNYKLIDVYVRYNAEGRSFVLPTLSMHDKYFKLSGLAIFKKDKMITKVDMIQAKWLNMLREKETQGIYVKDYEDEGMIDYLIHTEKKIRVEKNDDYRFFIHIDVNADVLSNKTEKDIFGDIKEQKKAEKDLEEEIRKYCQKFIYDVVYKYNVDCLSLGKYACAFYGRKVEDDWDKVVSESEIEVSVNVQMKRQGRSDF